MRWFVLLILFNVSAGDFVMKVESSYEGQLEQQGVVVGEKTLTFSRNSNFNCAPSTVVVLGKFDFPKVNPYVQSALMLQMQGKVIPANTVIAEKESIRFYAGNKIVAKDNPMFFNLNTSLNRLCQIFQKLPNELFNQKLAIISSNKTKIEVFNPETNKTKIYDSKKICQKYAKYFRCLIPNWGVANIKI